MITMKRSGMEDVTESRNGGVALLERPSNTANYSSEISATETAEEARTRMQRNLNRLLNYDREEVVEETPVVETPVNATLNEDITPTSTTLQFGNGNDKQILQDLNVSRVSDVVEEKSYKLSSKGKFMVVIYSLIVSVILALIVVNTGVLTKLENASAEKLNRLNGAQSEYAAIQDEIDSISGNDYVIDKAQDDLGMVPQA